MDGGTGGIGRVEWNITGTILSTAGCDGVVRLWKGAQGLGVYKATAEIASSALPRGEWRIHSTISCDDDDDVSHATQR